MLKKIKQYSLLKNSNALDLIPLQAVKSELMENGIYCLLVQRFRFKILNALFKRSMYFQIKLDTIGSIVWEQIDGKKTIQEIVDIIGEKDVNQENLSERIADFITSLYRKDLITFVIM